MIDPSAVQRLTFFKNDLQPLMKRFAQLPHDKREGVLDGILGAYVSAMEHQTRSLDKGCDRALHLFDEMLKRQEG